MTTTQGQVIEQRYPRSAALIRERIGEDNWNGEARMSAHNAIASCFDWHSSPEGWEFWNALYKSRCDK